MLFILLLFLLRKKNSVYGAGTFKNFLHYVQKVFKHSLAPRETKNFFRGGIGLKPSLRKPSSRGGVGFRRKPDVSDVVRGR